MGVARCVSIPAGGRGGGGGVGRVVLFMKSSLFPACIVQRVLRFRYSVTSSGRSEVGVRFERGDSVRFSSKVTVYVFVCICQQKSVVA